MIIETAAISAATTAITPATSAAKAAAAASGPGFGDALNRVIGAVETTTGAANTAISNMLDGSGDVHDAMIAMQRADMTFQLTVQMRNKLMQAYQEIMRMPV